MRRLAGAVLLLLATLLLASGLAALAGEGSFDRTRADPRRDPAAARRLEREARHDRTFLERWLHGLRRACFDVRIERPRRTIAGFEEADFEARYGVEGFGLAVVRATAEDSTERGRAGRLLLPAGASGVRLRRLPAGPVELSSAKAIALSVRNPGKVVRRLEATFEAPGARASRWIDVAPGPWVEWEMPVPPLLASLGGEPPASVLFAAPGTGEFLIDDLSLVEDRWTLRLGAPDLGYSLEHDAPVWTVLRSGLWNSFLLAASALLLTWAVAIPTLILAAFHRSRAIDRILSGFGFAGRSVPNLFVALFVLAFLVAFAGGGDWILALRSAVSEDQAAFSLGGRIVDRARHLLLPALALSAVAIAGLQRIARGNLLGALRTGYVLAARSRGVPESRVLHRRALRSAVSPLVSILWTPLANLLSGAALCEIVFGYPGAGRLLIGAAISRDADVLGAGVLAGGVLLVLGRLLADLLLRAPDPQVARDTLDE